MGIKKSNISALLITFNEEHNITEVLKNLDFADEIIVVDSFSNDATPKLVESHDKAKLIQREFKNYTDQKQFALDQANFEWVLFIDADERISEALKEEIVEVTKTTDNEVSAYFFVRKFMFKNRPLHFSGWQTDKNYRLFKKSKVKFVSDRIVHETLAVEGKTDILKNKLLHYSYLNFEDYKMKMVKYGKMRALEEFEKGKKCKWYHTIFRPFWKFVNHYILRLGFLDGSKGITICYLNALGVYSRYKELKRLNQLKNNDI